MARKVVGVVILALALVAMLPAPQAEAATFTVDRTDDPAGVGACTGAANDCSLRQAILRANAAVGSDVISIAAGNTYTLGLAGTNEDAAATGDLDITGPLTFSITGTGLVSVVGPSSGWDDRIFDVRSTVTISRLFIARGNPTGQSGGGIRVVNGGNLTANTIQFERNLAPVQGGALQVESGGTATIQQAAFKSNQATQGGGAITAAGTLNLYRSTVGHNDSDLDGGGILITVGTTTLDRVTVADNTADADHNGSGNGGGIRVQGGTLNVRNTIIGSNDDTGGQAEDCSGTVTSQGRNLLHRTAGCTFTSSTGDILNQNPLLGPLTGNSFDTDPFALLAGSPAIDAGDPTGSCTNDQRNLGSVDGNGDGKVTCDIGAFEVQTAGAAVTALTVTKTADTADGECSAFDCSLREAVTAANRVTGPQTITVPAGTYTITLAIVSDEEFNAADDFDLLDTTGATTITGPSGAAATIVESSGTAGRVFEVFPGVTANLTGLTIRNGVVDASEGSIAGGIHNRGTLTLDGVAVTANQAAGKGGGLLNEGTLTIDRSAIHGNLAADSGGGIVNQGTLTVRNTTFSDNRSNLSGGALFAQSGTATLQNVTVTKNTSDVDSNTTGTGGGIAVIAGATANLLNTLLAGNLGNGTGALVSDCSGTLTSQGHNILGIITGCTFALQAGDLISNAVQLGPLQNNGGSTPTHAPGSASVAIDGGDNTAVTCMGSFDQRGTGFTRIVDSNGEGKATCDIGAFEVQTTPAAPATLTVTTTADGNDDECNKSHCTLREAVRVANRLSGTQTIQLPAGTFTLGLAGADDTAAAGDLDLTGTTVIGGAGAGATIIDGGGVDRVFHLPTAGVNVSMSDLAIAGGLATAAGGGIENAGNLSLQRVDIFGNAAASGGGIDVTATGSLTLTDTTVRDNHTTNAGGGGGGVASAGTLNATNLTVSGNDAHTNGGGIVVTGGTATLTHVTIAGNSADSDQDANGLGGGLFRSGGSLTLRSTLVSDNLRAPATNNDCHGALTSQGTNLIRTNACTGTVASDLLGQAGGIGALAANGGPTLTHALTAGSPALDAAAAAFCPATDQRGQPRPQDGNGDTVAQCDIGAFEAVGLNPPTIQMQTSATNVAENVTTLGVVITRTCPCGADSSVQYTVTGGSATAGHDFVAATGTVNFTGSQSANSIDVTIINDALDEVSETFTVTLSNPTAAVLGATTTTTVTITDDDVQNALVEFTGGPYHVNETDTNVTITVQRTVNTTGETSVSYATASGSALAGSDYTGVSGTLTFNPGVSMLTFQVPILNDTDVEADETFTVFLNDVVGGEFGTPTVVGVIVSSDDLANIATLTGTITLQGRTPASPGNPPFVRAGFGDATITVIQNGTTLFQGFVQPDGTFSVTNLTPGVYDMAADAPGFLSARKLGFNVPPGTPNAGAVQLRAGRVTPDTTVNIVDVTAIIAAFGLNSADRTDGVGNFVDVNGDGVVNIQDITLTLSNFGRAEPLTWP